MGLDVYLYHGEESVELPSQKYPDHLFKIGYFRSSYNEGGINSVARQHNLTDLFDIFSVGNDDYEVRPDWKACLEVAKIALKEWQEFAGKDQLAATDVNWYDEQVTSGSQALDVYREALAKNDPQRVKSPIPWTSFSSRQGLFYVGGDSLKVVAAINGFNAIGSRVVYLVYQAEDGQYKSYAENMEIVVETIEYVLAQPDPENWLLHWSG